MAAIDGISYFTNGLCVPSGTLEGVSYFTNGLVLSGGTQPPQVSPRGGIQSARLRRQAIIREAQEEADFIVLLTQFIAQIENDE